MKKKTREGAKGAIVNITDGGPPVRLRDMGNRERRRESLNQLNQTQVSHDLNLLSLFCVYTQQDVKRYCIIDALVYDAVHGSM